MLKLIKQFITDNARRLEAQLSQFEQNVATEMADIRASYMPSLKPVRFAVSGGARAFGVGQIALIDSTLGNLVVTLSKPAGLGFAAVSKQVAANNAVIVPAGLNAVGVAPKINQLANKTVAAVGLYWFFFDGNNWQATV